MLKFSINHGNGLSFTKGLGRKAELRTLEKLNHMDSLVPEDLTAFHLNLILPQEDDCSSTSSEESDLTNDDK